MHARKTADASVWSLAFRQDELAAAPQVRVLRTALEADDIVVTTGFVLQQLLQGFAAPNARREIIDRFGALPLISPNREDHIDAADLRM